jgi:CRISPR/Cas system CSM-associated protein Csm3 (group 7 of RAMP superfamily)
MSRPRTIIRVELEILQPWGVGGVGLLKDVDLPIQVDPRGDGHRPHLPSTSLVGALRPHLEERLRASTHWLGALPVGREVATGNVTRTPSKLWALGTRLGNATGVSVIGSTAINPKSAAARGGTLRVEQRVDVVADDSLPEPSATNGPTTVSWYLQHDGEVDQGLLEALATWQPYIGRRRSAGQGRARVTRVTAFDVDLESVDGLTWWLGDRASWLNGGGPPAFVTTSVRRGDLLRGRERLSLDWTASEPLHVGTGQHGSEVGQRGQAREQRTSVKYPTIPGTTWKGIFRHRVEYILRLREADPAPVVEYLFGVGGKAREERTGRRGVLRFGESLLVDADGRPAPTVTRSHVAIDRVSGGPREGLLFSVVAVEEGALTTLTIETDQPLPEPLRNLLLHVARDIDDGLVGVGGGTTRGYGWLRLRSREAVESLGAVDVNAITSCVRAGTRVVRDVDAADEPPSGLEAAAVEVSG